MPRFFGKVGYGSAVEVRPGVFKEVITERDYYGDVQQNMVYVRTNDNVNGEMSFQTTIEVLADAYALENYVNIRFVEWAGMPWSVNSVKTGRPRLTLVVGEVYHGPRQTP